MSRLGLAEGNVAPGSMQVLPWFSSLHGGQGHPALDKQQTIPAAGVPNGMVGTLSVFETCYMGVTCGRTSIDKIAGEDVDDAPEKVIVDYETAGDAKGLALQQA